MSRLPGTFWPTCSSLLCLSTSRTAVPSVKQAAPPHMHLLLPLPSSLWALPYPPDVKPQPPPSPVLLHFAALLSPSTHQNTIYILLIHCAFITQWNKFHKGRNFFTVVGPKIVPSTVGSRSITVEKVNLSLLPFPHHHLPLSFIEWFKVTQEFLGCK